VRYAITAECESERLYVEYRQYSAKLRRQSSGMFFDSQNSRPKNSLFYNSGFIVFNNRVSFLSGYHSDVRIFSPTFPSVL